MKEANVQTQKPIVRIEDWAVVTKLSGAEYKGLQPGNVLVGKVFGHPRMHEGAFVFSSPLLSFDPKSMLVETRNTAYRLGRVSNAYEYWTHEHAGDSAA